MERKKICIIGGGCAGLVSAWLLEQEYDVTVVEIQDRLGGHAHTWYMPTLQGTTVPVEFGAELFNDVMFTHFMQLLKILQIPTSLYQFTYTFSHPNHLVCIPPRRHNKLVWSTLSPWTLWHLVQMWYFMHRGQHIVDTHNTQVTVQEYADSLWLTRAFKHEFLYPFSAAGWSVSPEEIQHFSAYTLLRIGLANNFKDVNPMAWRRIDGGVSSYIVSLVESLQTTLIQKGMVTTSLTRKENGQYVVRGSDGAVHEYDHVVIATNAYSACQLLKDLPEAQDSKAALAAIEYVTTTIALHSDERVLSYERALWSLGNIVYDGATSRVTIYHGDVDGKPVFKSWVDPHNMPALVHAQETFYHAKLTPAYFETQRFIATVQGRNNLWFAGVHTYDVDVHESSVISAMNIAKRLSPSSTRLRQLRG